MIREREAIIVTNGEFTAFMKEHHGKAHALARKNTKYNEDGQAILTEDDPWADEEEWDALYRKLLEQEERTPAARSVVGEFSLC